ncbi:MAG: lysophospholipid acyltransferase family protein [Actinomycetota bacterium]
MAVAVRPGATTLSRQPTRAKRYADPFDERSAERSIGLLRATVWRYFHPTVIGGGNIPDGRALIVGCHSGVMPYDAACLFVGVHEATGRYPRFIADRMFGRVDPIGRFLARQGAIVGTPDVVESLLEENQPVVLFPGGAPDMTRPYLTQRYRVLPHRGYAPGNGGYIKIALRTGSPIVPLAVVGAEEAHIMLGNIPQVARLVSMPFFPVVLFPMPLPTKIFIRFGKTIHLPGTPRDADDQHTVDRLNEIVRKRVQRLIDATLRHRRGIIFSRYERGGVAGSGDRGGTRR